MSKKRKSKKMESDGPRSAEMEVLEDKKDLRGKSGYNTDLTAVVEGDKFRDYIVAQFLEGRKVPEMAKSLAQATGKNPKSIRSRIWHIIRTDPRLTLKIHEAAKGTAQAGLIPAVQGLVERAERGRPDAVKPLMAVTKFHDPAVKHEHSGEVKISIDMPRPVKVSQEDETDDRVIDAEVVEELTSPEE